MLVFKKALKQVSAIENYYNSINWALLLKCLRAMFKKLELFKSLVFIMLGLKMLLKIIATQLI